MLILTRKVGEVIRIGDRATVRVLEVRGSQVRLGVDAPADIRIYREEVYQAIQREGESQALPGESPAPVDALPTDGVRGDKPERS